MNRYYVEFAEVYGIGGIYVYAYNRRHVRDILYDYKLVVIKQIKD